MKAIVGIMTAAVLFGMGTTACGGTSSSGSGPQSVEASQTAYMGDGWNTLSSSEKSAVCRGYATDALKAYNAFVAGWGNIQAKSGVPAPTQATFETYFSARCTSDGQVQNP